MKSVNVQLILALTILLVSHSVGGITISDPQLLDSVNDISCVRNDMVFLELVLVCKGNAVFSFNLTNDQYELIAGDYQLAGYKEGIGSEARFHGVSDLVQINESALAVADSWNNCLRMIVGRRTSTLAGRCESGGYRNGPASEALLAGPTVLLLVDSQLYITDRFNNAIRLLELSTFNMTTVTDFVFYYEFSNPYYMTCSYPDCKFIYFTYDHGIASVNRLDGNTTNISGGRNKGNATGSLEDTRFYSPQNLMYLTRHVVLVADYKNDRLLRIDLQNKISEKIMDVVRPLSFTSRNNRLFIGTKTNGLYQASLDDLPEGFTELGRGPLINKTFKKNGKPPSVPVPQAVNGGVKRTGICMPTSSVTCPWSNSKLSIALLYWLITQLLA